MRSGDHLSLTANGVGTFVSFMRLFAPDGMNMHKTSYVASASSWCPQTLVYNSPSVGAYYLSIYTWDRGDEYGYYSLAWMCRIPTPMSPTCRPKTIRRCSSVSAAGIVRYGVDSAGVAGQPVWRGTRERCGGWELVVQPVGAGTGGGALHEPRVVVHRLHLHRRQVAPSP
jgi:hypothetical protein